MTTMQPSRQPTRLVGPDGPRGLRVPDPPQISLRSRALRTALPALLSRWQGDLRIQFPDGTVVGTAAATIQGPVMRIHRDDFFRRCATDGKIGFGEAYMAGDWTADDLPAVLATWAVNLDRLPVWLQRLPHLSRRGRQDPSHANTLDGASRNVRAHYDLSNDLFATFLDSSLTYSSAVFADGDSLEQAQARKRLLLLDSLQLRPGHHLLEIGTGWGALAVDAARYHGCRVTTVTLSEQQAAFARHLVAREGLADRVEVQVRDYREVEGRYDRIVSVEMFEAVGERYWGTFFSRVAALLEPTGRVALQTITFAHDRYRVARGGYGWIHKYIFPGGEIPSLRSLQRPLADAGLRITARQEIGDHYARTLRHWRARFLAEQARVRDLGFDDVFIRMWEFYLAYCEAGFATRALGDSQLVLTHQAVAGQATR